jgi:hypothetical protein
MFARTSEFLPPAQMFPLPDRIVELRRREINQVPRVANWCITRPDCESLRSECVSMIYAMCASLSTESGTPFAAARLFDRAMYAAQLVPTKQEVKNMAIAAVHLARGCVDLDNASSDNLRLYMYYAGVTGSREDYSRGVWRTQCQMMRQLGNDLQVVTPHEYISEVTHWFDHVNASRGHAARTLVEAALAAEFLQRCDAAVHFAESANFTSFELAAAASYVETAVYRRTPQVTAVETPGLVAMWTSVPWQRGMQVCKLLRSSLEQVLLRHPNGGYARMHRRLDVTK